MTGLAANRGPGFSLYSLVVQAALEGSGVLMAHEALTADQIATGALIAPFPMRITTGLSLAILVPERQPPETLRIVDWLLENGRRPEMSCLGDEPF